MAWTNRGLYRLLGLAFRGQTPPANFYAVLVTSGVVPTVDTNTLSELTQIPNGQGYTTNGMQLTPNATDFDTWTEDDANNLAEVLLKDLTWTASGGDLPSSGTAAYLVITDNNATPANREVWAFFSLGGERVVSDGQPFTVQNTTLRLSN